MSATEETLQLLARIAAASERCAKALEAMAKTSVGPEIATDRDLDGKYGNEKVRFVPRDWRGESFKGCTMSECPADFLDLLAEGYDYFASKNSADEKKAGYDRKSAARARGWAKRIRAGWKPKEEPTQQEEPQDDAIDSGDSDTSGGGW